MKKQNQKGFTMVEIAIVVAIAALLLIGVTAAPRIIASNKANAEASELPQIVTGIQKVYANYPNYAGATLAQVIGMKALPDERVTTATTANNRWSGAITMATAATYNPNDSIKLSYASVPTRECNDVLQSVESRFIRIAVAGVDVKPAGGTLNLTTLGTQCGSANNVNIDYYFTK